jgi:hypothetical protein
MAWKKDLAKLKQDLKSEEPPLSKPAPRPKVQAPHPVSQSIEEEDAIFLSAMGLRPQPKARQAPAAEAAPPPLIRAEAPAPAATREEFSEAMGGLKGMKPIRKAIAEKPAPVQAPAPPPEPPPAPEPEPEPEVEPVPEPAAPSPRIDPAGPAQINLAAGMAIEVDGGLDLRGHARSDAEERLKERILDGYALGWRTLHVTLGPAADLRSMIMDLLLSPQGRCIARYAQAPIPMGGAHAWILYFRNPGSGTTENTLFNT